MHTYTHTHTWGRNDGEMLILMPLTLKIIAGALNTAQDTALDSEPFLRLDEATDEGQRKGVG